MVIVAAVVFVFLLAAAQRIGTEAGGALWFPVILGVIAFAMLAVGTWHRRRMHEIHELHAVEIGRWRRVNIAAPWPKACRDCGQTDYDWKSCRAHDDPEGSPCMRLRAARDAAELAPADHYIAEVTSSGGQGGQGDGAVDTMIEAGE